LAGSLQHIEITAYFFSLRETEKYSYLKFVIHIVIIASYLGFSFISFPFRTKSASEAKGQIGGLGIKAWTLPSVAGTTTAVASVRIVTPEAAELRLKHVIWSRDKAV
jgi:hypothetical protein